MTAEIINISDVRQKAEADAGIVRISMDDLFSMWTGQKTIEDIRRDRLHEQRLDELRRYGVPQLRRFWDEVGDTSYYEGPEGLFDCADIHRVLNEKGDGRYCAV